jgi:hypothetical protein
MPRRIVRRFAIVLAAGLLLAGAPLVVRALGDEAAAVAGQADAVGPEFEPASPTVVESSPLVERPAAPPLLDLGAALAESSPEPAAEPVVEPVTEPESTVPSVDLAIDAIPVTTLPVGPDPSQWAALRDCESGGDYTITNPSGKYRGAYQFDRSTWNSVAGRHDPSLVGVDPSAASPADQDAMALALYIERGDQPWPHCGRHLR